MYVPKQVDANCLSGALLSDCISFWLLIDFLRRISCSIFKFISDKRKLRFLKILKTRHCHHCTQFSKGGENGKQTFFQNGRCLRCCATADFLVHCAKDVARSSDCFNDVPTTLELSNLAYQY